MKHSIDPKIDCVFKAILGSEENRNLLIHFLNAVLADELPTPIVAVELLNPHNERETLNDKLSIVDVKAKDASGRLFQIEIQLSSYSSLPPRILYTWCDIYAQQLTSGRGYDELRPTYSIWLLDQTLFNDADHVHDFKPRDRQGRSLVEHGGIWTFELTKLPPQGEIDSEIERWLMFFKTGEALDDEALPAWMQTEEMRQAMSTVRQFSEKERQYHEYQARMNFLRQQRAIEADLEQARREKEQERREKEQARREKAQARQAEEQVRREKEAALVEIERLKAELLKRQDNH